MDANTMISSMLMLQSFFDHKLLATLVAKGTLTAEEAHTIAMETAVFGHEIADDQHRTESAIAVAGGFERIAKAFSKG